MDGNDYWKSGKLGSESELITDGTLVSKLPTDAISGSSQVNADSVTNFDDQCWYKIRCIDRTGPSQVNAQMVLQTLIKM